MYRVLPALLLGLFLIPSAAFAQVNTERSAAVNQLIYELVQKVLVLQAKLAALQAAPTYVDPTTQALLNAFEKNARLIERQERDRQDTLDDWASEMKEQTRARDDYNERKEAIKRDIRAEVEAAGGFMTTSQLEAMALKRMGY